METSKRGMRTKTLLMRVRAYGSDLKRAVECSRWRLPGLRRTPNMFTPRRAIKEFDESPSRGRFNYYTEDVDALWERLKDRVEEVEEFCYPVRIADGELARPGRQRAGICAGMRGSSWKTGPLPRDPFFRVGI